MYTKLKFASVMAAIVMLSACTNNAADDEQLYGSNEKENIQIDAIDKGDIKVPGGGS